MTTLGLIGSGNIGSTVARLAVAAGIDVVLSNSRGPETLAELDADTVTTSELLQRHLPESQVVKAFNNIYFEHLAELARPAGAADRSALPVFGDDPAAKIAAAHLIDALGYDVVDGGTLAESRRSQRDTPVYVHPYAVAWDSWPPSAATTGDAATVRAALAAAEV
ncbi:NADPH-dependent F420 reductase [Nocardia sp. NPDC055029]